MDHNKRKVRKSHKLGVGHILSIQPNDPNIPHKRDQISESNFQPNAQHTNQDNMYMRHNSNSYEVGFGIKSMINCEDISPNCIVMCEELGNLNKLPNNHVQDSSVNLDQHNIDEVPTTPPHKMAT